MFDKYRAEIRKAIDQELRWYGRERAAGDARINFEKGLATAWVVLRSEAEPSVQLNIMWPDEAGLELEYLFGKPQLTWTRTLEFLRDTGPRFRCAGESWHSAAACAEFILRPLTDSYYVPPSDAHPAAPR